MDFARRSRLIAKNSAVTLVLYSADGVVSEKLFLAMVFFEQLS